MKIRLKVDADFPVDMLVRGEAEVERRVREKDLFMTHITTAGRIMVEGQRPADKPAQGNALGHDLEPAQP